MARLQGMAVPLGTLLWPLALALAPGSLALHCPSLGPGGQERRAAGAEVVVRALVTQATHTSAELWVQEVFKGGPALRYNAKMLNVLLINTKSFTDFKQPIIMCTLT